MESNDIESDKSENAMGTDRRTITGVSSNWEKLLSQYEERNASLKRRQAALAEKVKQMEFSLPFLMKNPSEKSTSKSHVLGRKEAFDKTNNSPNNASVI